MLKQNNQKNSKQRKLHEAVLKHKVRNLRAKVQSLLPIHFCQKISKRNHRLKNQLIRKHQIHSEQRYHNRSHNSKSHAQSLWKYTSGYNIKKKQHLQSQKVYQNNYLNQSSKTSFHQAACECQNENELFFDNQFTNISQQKGKGKDKSKQIMLKGYHFQKLTDQQIEQIQEDKLYYLVEQKHITAYEEFIKDKYMQKITTPISNEVYKSVSKSTIAFGTAKNIRPVNKQQTNTSLESQNALKYHSSGLKDKQMRKTSFRYKQSKQRHQNSIMNNSKGSINNELRMFRNTTNEKLMAWNVSQNLARINQQQQVKRILLSMQIKTRQQRVQQNFRKIMNSRVQIIEQQNLKEHFKILTAQQKKRKIYNEVGEIVDLTEKLRKKCIQRKTYVGKQNLHIDSKIFNIDK